MPGSGQNSLQRETRGQWFQTSQWCQGNVTRSKTKRLKAAPLSSSLTDSIWRPVASQIHGTFWHSFCLSSPSGKDIQGHHHVNKPSRSRGQASSPRSTDLSTALLFSDLPGSSTMLCPHVDGPGLRDGYATAHCSIRESVTHTSGRHDLSRLQRGSPEEPAQGEVPPQGQSPSSAAQGSMSKMNKDEICMRSVQVHDEQKTLWPTSFNPLHTHICI